MPNIATHIFMQITQNHILKYSYFFLVWNCCIELIPAFKCRIYNYMLVCASSKQGNGMFKCEA